MHVPNVVHMCVALSIVNTVISKAIFLRRVLIFNVYVNTTYSFFSRSLRDKEYS